MTANVSQSRTYVASCMTTNFQRHYFVKFELPNNFPNNSERAIWHFLNHLDFSACVDGCFTFEDFMNLKEVHSKTGERIRFYNPIDPRKMSKAAKTIYAVLLLCEEMQTGRIPEIYNEFVAIIRDALKETNQEDYDLYLFVRILVDAQMLEEAIELAVFALFDEMKGN